MLKILVIGVFCFVNSIVLFAEQEKCYIAVESPGSYDELTVTTISLTMLRQFVDPKVQPAPSSGFSEKGCVYRINVLEQETGLKVFIIGENISDYGKSQLRGEPGLEQALLRSILKSLNEQTNTICKKYGSVLENECQEIGSNTNSQQQDKSLQQDNSQNRRIPPDCQKKEGEILPEKCNMFYENDGNGNQMQQNRRIPPDCQMKQGEDLEDLPRRCKRFYEDDMQKQPKAPKKKEKRGGGKKNN